MVVCNRGFLQVLIIHAENFVQFKSLSRVRDIRDQLAGLCDRVEVVIQSNPNSNDIVPIQKALTSGYFYNTVSKPCMTTSNNT